MSDQTGFTVSIIVMFKSLSQVILTIFTVKNEVFVFFVTDVASKKFFLAMKFKLNYNRNKCRA